MKVPALFTLVVVLGYHTSSACPQPNQLVKDVQKCLGSMMTFVNADKDDRWSKCPNLKDGIDCVDDILDACKDNPALRGQYDMLKDRMAQSRKDFELYCGSVGIASSGRTSSMFLIGFACLPSLWLRNIHM
ncbi:uncharacterized protein LOC124262445 [Haliotis rubra]|uniref:uncharacterized protein LOC124262445 n=1 Tax=Haliotis rubra TaxID=36100 RepID=UPI001EE503CE|nr:uncharacterized protein LOC124262445 [Haliotis rubra]